MGTCLPSIEAVRECLDYRPETGEFFWRKSKRKGFVGKPAGGVDPDTGYVRIRVCGKLLYAHRIAMAFSTGVWPTEEVDHINRDQTDNRIANLRLASRAENARNCGVSRNNKAGLKGVHYYKRDGCWVAEITVNRRYLYLGRFPTAEKAHVAYEAAAKKHFGEFARAA